MAYIINGKLDEKVVEELSNLESQIKELTDKKSKIVADIKKECASFSKSEKLGGYEIVVSSANFSLEFDESSFKKENPDLYREYSKVVYHPVSYTFKKEGSK